MAFGGPQKHTIESNDHRNISNPVSTQKQNSLFVDTNRVRATNTTVWTIFITRTTLKMRKTWRNFRRERLADF